MGCLGGWWLGIRPCFSNGVYVSVRDTDMFSPPAGGVCGAYAVAPLHVLHAVHENTVMLFESGICFGWGYGRVFATYGWRLWGVFNTPLHLLHVIHRNTEMFSESDTHHPPKYERVFRTRYTLSIKIRKRFPNWIRVIHRNAGVFFELGEGVDEPEDGEEDDGGAYDAVQYADAANVEPSAEA